MTMYLFSDVIHLCQWREPVAKDSLINEIYQNLQLKKIMSYHDNAKALRSIQTDQFSQRHVEERDHYHHQDMKSLGYPKQSPL